MTPPWQGAPLEKPFRSAVLPDRTAPRAVVGERARSTSERWRGGNAVLGALSCFISRVADHCVNTRNLSLSLSSPSSGGGGKCFVQYFFNLKIRFFLPDVLTVEKV